MRVRRGAGAPKPDAHGRPEGTQYNARVLTRALRVMGGLLVAVYLTGAGWFFILGPWGSFWTERVLVGTPFWLVPLVASSAFRGALAGFGIVHFAVAFVWLDGVLRSP